MGNYMSMHDRLTHALNAASDRSALVTAEPFPVEASLTILDTDDFVALAHADGGGVVITVSTGVVQKTAVLWRRAIALSDDLPNSSRLNVDDVEQVIDASLAWLMLHELHHHQIGHLELVGSAGIAETALSPKLGLTRRSVQSPSPLDGIRGSDHLAIRRCLELQADHDALAILLGHYDIKRWDGIRDNAAAAMAMMVLIDQQDQADDSDRTHPLSATRIFQLFGSLALLWMPDPNSDLEVPEDAEIKAFHKAVVAPAVSDGIILAEAGNTPPVVNSMEDTDLLFHDVRMLQQPNNHDLSQLQTAGAREYAALLPFNAKAIALLGAEKFSR